MSPADHIATHISKLREQLASLDIERTVLSRTIAELESVRKSMPTSVETQSIEQPAEPEADLTAIGTFTKPAVAVRRFLAQYPQGVTLKSLVDALSNEIKTSSSDPKRLLYNTVYNLRKRGTLVGFQDAGGNECVKIAAVNGTHSEEES